MSNIIEQVRKYVKEEFEKPEACFKPAYEEHFIPVVKTALELAEKEDADKEVVEIAAWLHDIGSIIGDYENHHILSAKIAQELLQKLNYPQEKIEKVKQCILSHRGRFPGKKETKEAQILADADALVNFGDINSLLRSNYQNPKSEEEAKQKILAKLEGNYLKLSDKAKPLVEDKLEKARKELA